MNGGGLDMSLNHVQLLGIWLSDWIWLSLTEVIAY
jgi:hypothetical protein